MRKKIEGETPESREVIRVLTGRPTAAQYEYTLKEVHEIDIGDDYVPCPGCNLEQFNKDFDIWESDDDIDYLSAIRTRRRKDSFDYVQPVTLPDGSQAFDYTCENPECGLKFHLISPPKPSLQYDDGNLTKRTRKKKA